MKFRLRGFGEEGVDHQTDGQRTRRKPRFDYLFTKRSHLRLVGRELHNRGAAVVNLWIDWEIRLSQALEQVFEIPWIHADPDRNEFSLRGGEGRKPIAH